MDTSSLKSFATSARTELIREVGARITAVLALGAPERVEQPRAVNALERAIAAGGGGDKGRADVADKVAYTWFNRIIALRFMDANGYTGIGVVSPASDLVGQPEVLSAAKRGQIDSEVVRRSSLATIEGLLNGTRQPRPGFDAQAEAYTLLLVEYCRHWNRAMPFMFEREGDFTELLIPTNLLAEDSALDRAAKVLTAEVCQDVEVIGWLYQFYISERKDEVFAGFKKNKKAGAAEIPAATQLFTPHWIVRYLVENSVGRLWMLNHPQSRLVDQMDYYIAPVDEEPDYLEINSPEDLKVIDPACGSGHMLTYAFDLLYSIYEEEGYAPSQIPSLILARNLYGTEIDQRAGALAAFALTMKAAAKRKLFMRNPVEPNVCVLEPIAFSDDELSFLTTRDGDQHAEEEFWNQFANADTFGSLIRPDSDLTIQLAEHFSKVEQDGDLFHADTFDRAQRVITQAKYLVGGYSVVVANPPYMGSKQMNAILSQFMKDEYPTGKADLMTAFMVRAQDLTTRGGSWAIIDLPSWMSLKSFEDLRRDLLQTQRIASLVHLGRGVFGSDFGSVAFVIDNVAPKPIATGVYRRLFEQHVDVRSVATIERLFLDREYNSFEVKQADFAVIPGSPIVYWLSEKMRAAFKYGNPLSDVAEPNQGLITADNSRFLRHWWEVSESRTGLNCLSRAEASESRQRWFPYNKGGDFRRWYGNHEYVVNWEQDGAEIREFGTEKGGRPRSRAQNTSTYFSPAVSWSDISSGAPSFRSFPNGFIHGNKGNSLFGTPTLLTGLLGVMNAPCVTVILEALTPTMTASVGDVAKTPIPDALATLPTQSISSLAAMSKADWDEAETSWGFDSNPLVRGART